MLKVIEFISFTLKAAAFSVFTMAIICEACKYIFTGAF